MKRIFHYLLLIIVIATGCKKTSNNSNNNPPNNNYYFTAKIDGTDWSADMNSTNTYAEEQHAGFLTLSASLPTVTDGFFLVNISGYNGKGNYAVGGAGNNSYARYTTGTVANNTYSAWKAEDPGSTTTGSFEITSDDGAAIEGTFHFDGYSEEKKTTKKITEGKFRIKKN